MWGHIHCEIPFRREFHFAVEFKIVFEMNTTQWQLILLQKTIFVQPIAACKVTCLQEVFLFTSERISQEFESQQNEVMSKIVLHLRSTSAPRHIYSKKYFQSEDVNHFSIF